MSETPPVLSCSEWDGLLSVLPDGRGGAMFRIDTDLARAVAAAPAALAYWIASRSPRLCGGRRLRLLVAGAESVDAVDEGRWYGLLPRLLGREIAVETTLIGPELDASFSSAAAQCAPLDPACLVCDTLEGYFERGGAAHFDLAMLFHPGLGKHRGWLQDGSLARLIAAGVEVIAAAYEEDEFEMERWVVESYGYGVEGGCLLNPFFLDLDNSGTRARWGRILWKFAPVVPGGDPVPDRDRLDQLDTLTRMTMHSVTVVGEPGPDPGARIVLQSQTGARLELLHVFDHRFVNPRTRELLKLGVQGRLEPVGSLPSGELAAYPGENGGCLRRAMWAARVKETHLLSTYPASMNPAAVEAKQKEMLGSLRARAARLFGR